MAKLTQGVLKACERGSGSELEFDLEAICAVSEAAQKEQRQLIAKCVEDVRMRTTALRVEIVTTAIIAQRTGRALTATLPQSTQRAEDFSK
eukprot:1097702-Pleurochrysis_carterae.AAC.13